MITLDLNYINGIYYLKTEYILNDDDFNVLKRSDKERFIRYLRSKSYGFNSGYKDVDSIIRKEFSNIKEELDSIVNNTLVTDIFFFEEDITNMKLIYKEVMYNQKTAFYSDLGRFSKEALVEFFKFGNLKLIPSNYHPLFIQISKIVELDLQEYLQRLEKVVNNFYTDFAKSNNKYKILYEYLEIKKSHDNLKTFMKFKKRNEKIENLEKALLKEDQIGIKTWVSLYTESNNNILNKLRLYFNNKIVESIKDFLQTGNNVHLRYELENIKADYLKSKSYDSETLAPIVYYLYLKLLESRKVREIYYEK